MKKIHVSLMMLMAMMAMTSCNKNLFDKSVYDDSIQYEFKVDDIDLYHDWNLIKSSSVTVNSTSSDIYRVQLLTENPYTTTTSEITAERSNFGQSATMFYSLPITQNNMYAAAFDKDGNFLGIKQFKTSANSVTLSTDLLDKGVPKSTSYQTFTYIYESTFPIADDFDFNDMVLRISKKLPDPSNLFVVDLTVTLDAAGAKNLYGAAIQLPGIKSSDISNVEIVEGDVMDAGYPLSRLFTDGNILTTGNGGVAVINLFESAQWALSKGLDDMGDVAVIRYNTDYNTREGYSDIKPAVTTTYRITFKDSFSANFMTLASLDPFLIWQYDNGSIWEVHTYKHKNEGTLNTIDTSVYDSNISWALVIPKADFRYPKEGIPLSTYQSSSDATFGAYEKFSEWMKDHLTNRDWYMYETRPQLLY